MYIRKIYVQDYPFHCKKYAENIICKILHIIYIRDGTTKNIQSMFIGTI
jgi:hypothetical protein